MRNELEDLIEAVNAVLSELSELLDSSNNLMFYTVQIAGKDSNLNSLKTHVASINQNSSNLKVFFSKLTKELATFSLKFASKGLSFFYPIPSNISEEAFFNQPLEIIDKILKYGILKGKTPIYDPNPIYEAFGISHHFPEKENELRNTLLLLYRNIILRDLFYPLNEIVQKEISKVIISDTKYDLAKIFDCIFVIESEIGMKQGTVFYLKNIGLITCDHCIRDDSSNGILQDLKIFRGKTFAKKYEVEVIKCNSDLDIAILQTAPGFLNEGLDIGNTKNLELQQDIAIAGFPNYTFGDEGSFVQSKIASFRNYSGIRHILVSNPIISGNSGGPGLNAKGEVVGIAVTGADKMSNANKTEKHGLIPIDAINNLLK